MNISARTIIICTKARSEGCMYKILIVEDDDKICAAIRRELEKWGFEAAPVCRFDSVMEEFLAFKPHLVIMDVNLPSRDGFYWCGRIREVSKAPVLFLSSRDSSMDIVMAVGMGGDDYIAKPFSLEVLVAKINALLRRAYSYHEAGAEALSCGGVVLTLNDNTLRFDRQAAELTRNEFKILSLLMRNPGAIVSRERIMKELWQDESFIDDNTLTVNVNRLRKRLADIGLSVFIRTVKNQGYEVG